jgi:hypothetical protein
MKGCEYDIDIIKKRKYQNKRTQKKSEKRERGRERGK